MKATIDSKLVFLGLEQKTSSKNPGSLFDLICLADPLQFEKFEFFKRDDLVIDETIKKGDMVDPTFLISRNGYKTNVDLVKLSKIKAS